MAPRDRFHILVRQPATAEEYTSYASGRGSLRPPAPIREEHGRLLVEEAQGVAVLARERRTATGSELGLRPTAEGLYITFESWPGFELELSTFDPLNAPPELVAVREVGEGEEAVQLATVYVPEGSLSFFLGRFEQYTTEDTPTGKPRHANMVERIAGLRLATVEALWTDDPGGFPAPDDVVWWEVWLRVSDGREVDRLRIYASIAGLAISNRQLVFDNRVIVLVRASAQQLGSALDIIDDFAELRSAHTNASFFTHLSQIEQADWVDELVARTEPAPDEAPAACVLDTGVTRGHPLLEPSLGEADMHACDPGWGAHDHHGHGTAMAGVALYGDLNPLLRATIQSGFVTALSR